MGINIGQVDPQTMQKLLFQGPQSMLVPSDQQQPSPQSDSQAPQPGALAQAMQSQPQATPPQPQTAAPKPEPTAPQPSTDVQPAHVPSFDEYHAQHGDVPIGGAPPPVPHHGMLAKILLGAGEALGNPLATRIGERDRDIALKNQQYEIDKPALQFQANRGAYQQDIGGIKTQQEITGQAASTSKTLQEIQNMRVNPPGKEEFLQKFAAAIHAGEQSPQDVLNQYLALSHSVPGVTRGELVNLANSTPTAPPQFKIGTQGIREPLRYMGRSWYGNEPDAPPEIQNAAKTAKNVETEVQSNADKAAGRQGEAQSRGFENAARMQLSAAQIEKEKSGRDKMMEPLGAIRTAQNNQQLIEQLGAAPDHASRSAIADQLAQALAPPGSKKLSPPALEQVYDSGSVPEKVRVKINNWLTGAGPIPEEAIPEWIKVAKQLNPAKIKTATDTLEDINSAYGVKHPSAGGNGRLDQQQGGGKLPQGATHIVPGPDGKNHYTNAAGTVDLGIAP